MNIDITAYPFNAVFDGRDNTQALIDAMDAAATVQGVPDQGGTCGGVVKLPKGTMVLSAPIVVPNSVVLDGEGTMSTVIRMSDNFDPACHFIQLGSNNVANFGTRLQNLQLWSDRANVTYGRSMVYSNGVQHTGGLDRVKIFAGSRAAVWLEGGYGGASYVTLRDVETFHHNHANNPAISIDYGDSCLVDMTNIVMQGPVGQNAHPDPTNHPPYAMQVQSGLISMRNAHIEGLIRGIAIGPQVGAYVGVDIVGLTGGAGMQDLLFLGSILAQGSISARMLRPNGAQYTVKNHANGQHVQGNVGVYTY